jgi:hypothetical protein
MNLKKRIKKEAIDIWVATVGSTADRDTDFSDLADKYHVGHDVVAAIYPKSHKDLK